MASIVSAGTTSATALNMSADTSGVLQLASNNGTVALTISTAQNVGIGTSSPAYKLDVRGSAQNGIYYKTSGTYSLIVADNTSATGGGGFGAYVNGVQKAVFATSGWIKGDTSIDAAVYADSGGGIQFFTNNVATARATIDTSGQFQVGTTAGNSSAGGGHFTGPIIQGASGLSQQQISINSGNTIQSLVLGVGYYPLYLNPLGGNVSIGSTVDLGYKLGILSTSTATPALYLRSTASGDVGTAQLRLIKNDATNTTSQIFIQFVIDGNNTNSGQINANGASQAAFGSFSDIRLKENIENLPSQLNNIMALRPVEFDYIDGAGHQIGFIAQEMEQVYPDAIGIGEDEMLTVTGWSKTEARLVKAIQELNAKVTALENK